MDSDLKNHLETNKPYLTGSWVDRNASYEDDICVVLRMNPKKSRYWDAEWNGLFLEFKKGRSIWIDLVRYSEILLQVDMNASKETMTTFFIPNKTRTLIEEIIVADTKRLIEKLRLNTEMAKALIELNKIVPRSLNAQASLTVNDKKGISKWII